MRGTPRVQYARNGDINIAYMVAGDGPVDLLFVGGWFSHQEMFWEAPNSHIGARVAALAQPGEVLVSRTVRDLVAGSDVLLEDRGEHTLKGVPEPWRVYAVS